MTTFFIPGLAGADRATEDEYVRMRSRVEADTGCRPCDRRIVQVSSRRGGVDCLTEVGSPDPIHGGTVLAIFDLGPHQPFVAHLEPPIAAEGGISEVLSSHVYSVTEFEQ
jgi:hypothetical protein